MSSGIVPHLYGLFISLSRKFSPLGGILQIFVFGMEVVSSVDQLTNALGGLQALVFSGE